MKRIVHEPGGRLYKGEDFLAMQQLTLDLTEKFFAQYGNFILYGCERTGNNISPGVAMIDGKACLFEGAQSVSLHYFVRKVEITENVPYKTGDGPGYITHIAQPCSSSAIGAIELDNLPNAFATAEQGNKADTAVQTAIIGSVGVPKEGTVLKFPAYPVVPPAIVQQSGEWTPTNQLIESHTFARWFQVGNMLHIQAQIKFTTTIGSATQLILQGIPIAAAETSYINAIYTHINGANSSIISVSPLLAYVTNNDLHIISAEIVSPNLDRIYIHGAYRIT